MVRKRSDTLNRRITLTEIFYFYFLRWFCVLYFPQTPSIDKYLGILKSFVFSHENYRINAITTKKAENAFDDTQIKNVEHVAQIYYRPDFL